MVLMQQLAVNSDCYKAGKIIVPKGLILHSVGCPQPSASVFANQWNRAGQKACCHAVIDNTGTVIQTLPWTMRGWHCGGSANNTHIGIEMTEPSTIKYTGGANWVEQSDGRNTAEHVLATYKTAVQVFSTLCKVYNLDPLKDGVILSHHEAHLRGLASNHGDVEHIWSRFGLTMITFRQDVYNALKEHGAVIQESATDTYTKIMGKTEASLSQCKQVLLKNNVDKKYIDLVNTYFNEGEIEGVRGDIALAQSIVETGWFTFKGDVIPEQNNYAGLGTTGGGVKGCYFDTPQIGIRAQIQHLKAYASKDTLNKDVVDPRFGLVVRESAPYVEWLGQQENPKGYGWAKGKDYGKKVLNILNTLINEKVEQQTESVEDKKGSYTVNFTDKEGNTAEFSADEWFRLIMWVYANASDDLVSKYTVDELKSALVNK